MPVTELAILRLSSPNLLPSHNVLQCLHTAKLAMESYSGHPFYYFHCLEDPATIYIIGTWPSVDFHMKQWIPSRENQDLLKSLEGQLAVDCMFHIDIDQTLTPLPTDANVIGIGRLFTKAGQRDGFQAAFDVGRVYPDEFAGDGNVVGGWRIDGEEEEGGGREEFVLFTGWESKKRHLAFWETEGCREFMKIGAFTDGADVKHAKMLNVGV